MRFLLAASLACLFTSPSAAAYRIAVASGGESVAFYSPSEGDLALFAGNNVPLFNVGGYESGGIVAGLDLFSEDFPSASFSIVTNLDSVGPSSLTISTDLVEDSPILDALPGYLPGIPGRATGIQVTGSNLAIPNFLPLLNIVLGAGPGDILTSTATRNFNNATPSELIRTGTSETLSIINGIGYSSGLANLPSSAAIGADFDLPGSSGHTLRNLTTISGVNRDASDFFVVGFSILGTSVVPVPEPSSIFLGAIGGLAAFSYSRRLKSR